MITLLGLDLAGKRVVLVGGGPVSARRAAPLAEAGADLVVVAPQLCEDLADMVAAGAASWLQREVRDLDLDGAWLIHTASGDRAVDNRVARWAHDRRIWCINAAEATAGSARMPATAVVGDLVAGIASTGPAEPGRAARVRDSVSQHLRSGQVDLRARRSAGGIVTLVGGGPGADDLITVRGMIALNSADVIVTDRLGPTGLLCSLPSDVEIIDVGKSPGHHPVPQHEINQVLIDHARRGRSVVRLKGGDPFVLGRGGEEVLACRAAGVRVEVVPGVSSAVAVPAAAGIPVTHRGVATAFHVITGHDGLTPAVIQGLRARSETVVVLMGVSMLPQIVATALAAGVDPGLPMAIVERGWQPDQRVLRMRLQDAADAGTSGVRAPAVIVLGAVADLDLWAGEQR